MKNILSMTLLILTLIILGSICLGGVLLAVGIFTFAIGSVFAFMLKTISFFPIIIFVVIGILLLLVIIGVGYECLEKIRTYFKKN